MPTMQEIMEVVNRSEGRLQTIIEKAAQAKEESVSLRSELKTLQSVMEENDIPLDAKREDVLAAMQEALVQSQKCLDEAEDLAEGRATPKVIAPVADESEDPADPEDAEFESAEAKKEVAKESIQESPKAPESKHVLDDLFGKRG